MSRALRLGIVAVDVLPQTRTLTHEGAGVVLYTVGCITAIILWAYSLAWLAYAVASIMHQRNIPFNMGWWGFTFPLGMLALTTTAIGTELSSRFLKVLGTVGPVLECVSNQVLKYIGTCCAVYAIVAGRGCRNREGRSQWTTSLRILRPHGRDESAER
jgi:tellurite resistance protein TehA-like permease